MDGHMFDGVAAAVVAMMWITVPLSLWKLVEIVVWLCHHHISLSVS